MIKQFLSAVKRTVKFSLLPKISLASPTVFINNNSWKLFRKDKFATEKYNIVCSDIERVKRSDLGKITAYIGQINKKYLPFMTGLDWLQLPHHGFNGFDNKDLYAKSQVKVSNVKNVFALPIARFCLSSYYFINCYALRNISNFKADVSKCSITSGLPVITIIGFGNIGMCLAELAKKSGFEVYGIKRNWGCNIPDCLDGAATPENMDEFIKKSDLVVNLLPETKDTVGFYNIDFFKKMKPDAVFCNVGRGSAVVDDDIVCAVNSGIVKGAVLDAASRKKYPADNIIVTGHMSSYSSENAPEFDKFYTSQLKKYLDDKSPDNILAF